MVAASLLAVSGLVGVAQAANAIGYITELPIFSQLAPCAASAIGFAASSYQGADQCGNDPTKLQSCICSNDKRRGDLSSVVISDLSNSCDSSATDDRSSATLVLNQYCNPATTIALPTPTANIISQYIWELPEYSNLAPCAASAVSYALDDASYKCPKDASLWGPCICTKAGIANTLSSGISSFAQSTCSNGEDATSAVNYYSNYCNLNKGAYSFAAPAKPPGDMSYYITALPQFKSLNSCAQSALSYIVQAQTSWQCLPGPQALASCVCIKQGISGSLVPLITSSVKDACSTSIEDVNGAVSAFAYYCSAANNKVKVNVAESIAQSYATGSGNTGGAGTGSQNGAKPTGSSPTGSAGSDGNGSSGDGSSSSSGLSRGAVAGIAVAACLVGIGALAALIFFIRRRRRRDDVMTPDAGSPPAPIKPGMAEAPTPSHSPWSEIGSGQPDGYAAPNELASPYDPRQQAAMHEAASHPVSPNTANSYAVQGYQQHQYASQYNPNQAYEMEGGGRPHAS